MPRVSEDQPHARIEERELAIAMLELVEIELGDCEGGGAREEGDLRAFLAVRRLADDLERRFGVTVAEAHEMLFTVAPDGQVEPFAERVDDAHADPVEAAGDFVRVVVGRVLEFPAGVELGHDDLGRRHAFTFVDPGRYAAAIILDRDRSIRVQLDENTVAMAGQCLVDRIVGDFEHHVVKTRPVVGIADVHAGAFAHRIEAFEDLDALGAIFILIGVDCHSPDIGICGAKSRARVRVRPREGPEALAREVQLTAGLGGTSATAAATTAIAAKPPRRTRTFRPGALWPGTLRTSALRTSAFWPSGLAAVRRMAVRRVGALRALLAGMGV